MRKNEDTSAKNRKRCKEERNVCISTSRRHCIKHQHIVFRCTPETGERNKITSDVAQSNIQRCRELDDTNQTASASSHCEQEQSNAETVRLSLDALFSCVRRLRSAFPISARELSNLIESAHPPTASELLRRVHERSASVEIN